jgi:thiol:disulfide interchange protein
MQLVPSDRLAPGLTHLAGVLVVIDSKGAARAFNVDFPLGILSTTGNFLFPLLFAFLGGLLLNLMPCVFPVLSLKILSVVRMGNEEKTRARRLGWVYSLGILASFWLLVAVLLALRFGGQQIGWGFQLQSPRFIFVLACVLFVFGLNLLGLFEFSGRFAGTGSSLADREGYTGAFFTGVLATVVATPCTAPFMGSAVGYSLSQPIPIVFAIFTALAFGLALPYLLLSHTPGLARFLPRPGAWMETFKQLMAFLVFGTVIWLSWVLGLQASIFAMVVLLSTFLAIAFAVWMARANYPKTAIALAIISVATATFFVRTSQEEKSSASELTWEKFTPEKVAEYRTQGKPIFIDFTAAWCVSCQVNELLVFRSTEVKAKLKKLGVVLIKADWTNQDPEITKTLASFGRNGVPFYIIYGKGKDAPAVPLPEVINAGLVLKELEKIQ